MSRRKITVDDLRQEWASLMQSQPVVPTAGKTATELASEFGISVGMARNRIRKLLAEGRLRMIGVRPGKGHADVYEVVK